MARDDNTPAALTKRDAERLKVAGRKVQNTPPPPPPARREPGPTEGPVMAILSQSLRYLGKANAVVYRFKEPFLTAQSTGRTIEVHDWLLQSGERLPINSRIIAQHIGGRWVVVQSANCPVEE